MGRRKKSQKEEIDTEDVQESGLSEDTQRSIGAMIAVFFAIVFVLGFFGIAGVVGMYLNTFAESLFGWGKWLFPVLLLLASIVLLRKNIRFYIASIVGLGLVYLALLGLFHIFFDPARWRELVGEGMGGGYIGYGMAYGLSLLFGKISAVVLLILLGVIGILVALNSSLLPVFSHIKRVSRGIGKKKIEQKIAPTSSEDAENQEKEKEVISPSQPEESTPKPREAEVAPDDIGEEVQNPNIKNIRFQGAELVPQEEDDDIGQDDAEDTIVVSKNTRTSRQEDGYDVDEDWELPELDLLAPKGVASASGDVERKREIIEETLKQFGISVEAGGEQFGPTVTQYMFRPAAGVKLERIVGLSNNLAMALSAQSIRIEAPIPGKSLVGIEVPNRDRGTVCLRDVMETDAWESKRTTLAVPFGKNVSGDVSLGDLERMPHLLIAGTTGSGKSVCINALLTALLYQNTPEQLQLILVDPKRVELSLYAGIPHLKAPVIVENKKVLGALRWAVGEMERRYQILQEHESRNISAYNEMVIKKRKRGSYKLPYMPYVVIVIDELADLMGTHGKEVEGSIVRLAQMARAVGIHLVIATQRPDVHVLTGLIKSNIPTRIAFKVPTQVDSRTILDKSGAEKLLGLGDMLYINTENPAPTRIQGVYISAEEVKRVVRFWREQGEERDEAKADEEEEKEDSNEEENLPEDFSDMEASVGSFHSKLDIDALEEDAESAKDPLFDEAKELVERAGKASTSLIQRHLRIGYNRAARIVDELEAEGVVGPADGAKPREVFSSAVDEKSE